MTPGRMLGVETLAPALVLELRRLADCGADVQTRDTTLGVYVADLETLCLNIGDRVDFTRTGLRRSQMEAPISLSA